MASLLILLAILASAVILMAAPLQWKKALRAHRLLVRYLAGTFGLESEPTPDDFGARLIGKIEDFELTIEAHALPRHFRAILAGRRRPLSGGVAYLVEGQGHICAKIGMRRADTRTSEGDDEVLTGDADFDRHVAISGSEVHALAVLDPETRSRALHLIRDHGVILQDGRVSHFESTGLDDADRLALLVQGLLDFAMRMRLEEGDIPTRLAQNLAIEVVPQVRQRLALALFGAFPNHRDAIAARQAYLHDADPGVRFYARIADPIDGRAHLQETLDNRHQSLELRAFAARRLGQDAILYLLPELRPYPALLKRSFDAIANAGDGRAEPALIHALEHESSLVRGSAAVALGKLGTLAAVPPLCAIRDAMPLVIEGSLKKVATRAIAEIQARHGHPADGALSVTSSDGDRGALSHLAAEPGALSDTDGVDLQG